MLFLALRTTTYYQHINPREMNYISVNYTIDFYLDFAPNYKYTKSGTKSGKCFNFKTGREIKQAYNSGSIGYYINGKFQSLKKLRKHIKKIKEPDFPF